MIKTQTLMFRIFSIGILFIFSINLILAQSTYEINVKVNGFAEKEAYLAYHYGDKQYIKDTVQLSKDGYYTFSGQDSLKGGIYLFVMPPKNNFFQILINTPFPQFTIETDTLNMVKNCRVKGSPENDLFYSYLNFLDEQRVKAQGISEKMGKASEQEKETLQQEQIAINQQVKQYQLNLLKDRPQALTAAIVKASMDIDTPEEFGGKDDKEKQFNRWMYFKQHWFDRLDLSDDRMLRTPVMWERINSYLSKLIVQQPDSISRALSYILDQMPPKSESFQFYLVKFLNEYASSKVIGMDAVYVNLVKKYYATGMAYWTDEEQLAKIIKNANTLEPILIGKIAPDIELEKEDKSLISLHDVDSDYTILYFWDPDCGHCKKSLPKVKEFYEKYHDKGVEILAVCTKVTKDVPKCWETIKEQEMVKWINAADPYLRSRYKQIYDVRTTPQIFVLDRNKEILFKRLSAEQLAEVMDNILKRAGGENMTGD